MIQFQTSDCLLLIAYLIALWGIGTYISRNYNSSEKKRFFIGLTAKIVGCLFFMAAYMFYFKLGDTFFFYEGASSLWNTFAVNPIEGLQLWQLESREHSAAYFHITSTIGYFNSPAEWSFIKIAGLINLLCFNNFFCLSVCFAFLSFLGSWAIYRVFSNLYPGNEWPFFYVILLVPSCLIWSSGLLKDTFCLAFIGFVFYAAYKLLHNSFHMKYVTAIVVGFFLIWLIKPYLAYTFSFSIALWLFLKFLRHISQPIIKSVLVMSFFAILFLTVINLFGVLRQIEGQTAFQESMAKVEGYHYEFERSKQQDNSNYTLGTVDYSVVGILKKAPIAIVTALVKPFIWEPSKPAVKLMGLESLAYLIGLLWIVLRSGFWSRLSTHLNNDEIFLCFSFVLFLSLVVGITAYNYGLLMRLRTPLLPFFGAGLVILHQSVTNSRLSSQ